MRKTRHKILFAIFIAAQAAQGAVSAQDITPKAELRRNGHFANMFRFVFKPGKSDEALEILKGTLLPAYRKAGIKVELIEDLMGTKDVYLIVPLRSGPNYYLYDVPPEDADAWKALMDMSGGPAEGEQRMDAFIGYVMQQSQSLVFVAE